MATTDLPHLPLDELQAAGYLQEANRLFFHPLGLALAIEAYKLCEECRQQWPKGGEQCARCGNRTWTAERAGLCVLDDRGDEEGWYFEDVTGMDAKAAAVEAEWERRAAVRQAALGYVIQPVE